MDQTTMWAITTGVSIVEPFLLAGLVWWGQQQSERRGVEARASIAKTDVRVEAIHKDIAELTHNTNSIKDALIATTKEAAGLAGEAIGRAKQRAETWKDAALTLPVPPPTPGSPPS